MEPAQQEGALRSRLRALCDSGRSLAAAEDPEALLGQVLSEAKRLAAAEAAYLFEAQGDGLRLTHAQNDRVETARLAALSVEALPAGRDASLVGRAAATGEVVVAPDVRALPDGLRHDARVDDALGTASRAVIAVPVSAPGRGARAEAGTAAVLLLTHSAPGGIDEAGAAMAGALAAQAGLLLRHLRALAALRVERREVLFALSAAAEVQDDDVPGHVRRVFGYVRVLSQAVGLEPAQVEEVALASTLHDVGKIGIPAEILYKPGKLTDAEFERTKEHCARGAAMLGGTGCSLLEAAAVIARGHHERWDGGGYPDGLAEEAIPMPARITAVADVFDALTTPRTYRAGLGVEQALKIIAQEAGRHFDPTLVTALQGSFSEILAVKREFSHSESRGFDVRASRRSEGA